MKYVPSIAAFVTKKENCTSLIISSCILTWWGKPFSPKHPFCHKLICHITLAYTNTGPFIYIMLDIWYVIWYTFIIPACKYIHIYITFVLYIFIFVHAIHWAHGIPLRRSKYVSWADRKGQGEAERSTERSSSARRRHHMEPKSSYHLFGWMLDGCWLVGWFHMEPHGTRRMIFLFNSVMLKVPC